MRLGQAGSLDFARWCEGLAKGRSYVSDGYAHAPEFLVNGLRPGTSDVELAVPGSVKVRAKVAFAAEVPEGAGDVDEFNRLMAHAPRWADGLPLAVEGYRDTRFRG